jgi:hypothetical protein
MAKRRHLQCPYCDNYLRNPIDINFKSLDITGGMCPCSAVYVLDRTGHNLGEIYMDALQFVCKGDIDRALELDPDDYKSVELDYDDKTNTTGRTGAKGKLSKLLFVRLLNKE